MLTNNPRFQNEYHKFREGIDRLTDARAKNQAQRLLKDLLAEVNRLDQFHQGLNFQKKLPDDISMARNKLTEIRKKLNSLIGN